MNRLNTDTDLIHPMSYWAYREQMVAITKESASNHLNYSADQVTITRLNIGRMDRVLRRVQKGKILIPEISMKHSRHWVVLTEGWCGDSAQICPLIYALSEKAGIEVYFINRDKHPEIMDAFLTNGSRSIPKLVALNDKGQVWSTWGPRPEALQKAVQAWRSADHVNSSNVGIMTQKWYNDDRGRQTVDELADLV